MGQPPPASSLAMHLQTASWLNSPTSSLAAASPPLLSPTRALRCQLIRYAVARCLVGVTGYREKYCTLTRELEDAVGKIESVGIPIVNGHNRIKGSTVIAVEDPSAVMARKLKKLGHSFAYLYHLHPEEPVRRRRRCCRRSGPNAPPVVRFSTRSFSAPPNLSQLMSTPLVAAGTDTVGMVPLTDAALVADCA